ncbi:hypothetical protein [Kutzneria sp. NPDC052558]|uniref:hypothetical protein n=1 Tax=Kutzneria sp. NPDC052558 TaxID=3364121 RepID=UPI0037C78234
MGTVSARYAAVTSIAEAGSLPAVGDNDGALTLWPVGAAGPTAIRLTGHKSPGPPAGVLDLGPRKIVSNPHERFRGVTGRPDPLGL